MEIDENIEIQLDKGNKSLKFNDYFKYIYDYHGIRIIYIDKDKRKQIETIFNRETLINTLDLLIRKNKFQQYKYHSIFVENIRILVYKFGPLFPDKYYLFIPFRYVSTTQNTIYMQCNTPKFKYVYFGMYYHWENKLEYDFKPILLTDRIKKNNYIYIEDGRTALIFILAFRDKNGFKFPPELYKMMNDDYKLCIPNFIK